MTPSPIDFNYIWNIVVILIILYVISAAFNYLQQFMMAGISQKVVYDLRYEIDEKLAKLPLKFFDSHTHGELLSRFTNDVDNISSNLATVDYSSHYFRHYGGWGVDYDVND